MIKIKEILNMNVKAGQSEQVHAGPGHMQKAAR